jgi:hypothetical protein
MAAFCANFEYGVREIIALSTRTLIQLLLVVDAAPVCFIGQAFFPFVDLCFS